MGMKQGAFTGWRCAVLSLFVIMMLSSGALAETEGTTLVFFPEPAYTFDAVFEGVLVPHDFVIQNNGTAVLNVNRVEGG
ncbi:MAG: hypothetical protein QG552_1155 [Thermodesulfobacteriota bacterium]|nr:hypothetical protein [Thermodesulfobacteriota bacterium]